MASGEYTHVIVGAAQSDSEYVISEGTMHPGGSIPDHYHKWEDQTFHIIKGQLEAKMGDETFFVGPGDSIHCPRGISHYMKNIGDETAHIVSYVFPGIWAEAFMEETSRQNNSGEIDFKLIEEKFGVVYL